MQNNQDNINPLINDEQSDDSEENETPIQTMERYRANKITDFKFSLWFEIIGIIFFGLSMAIRYNSTWQQNYDLIFIIFFGYIALFRVPLSMVKLYLIIYKHRELRITQILTFVSEIFQVALAVYANVIYYNPRNSECRFYIIAGIFMLYVYYVLYKICIFILVAIILIPWILTNYLIKLRQKSKRKRLRKSLISKLVKIKYWQEEWQGNSEWAIWLEDFTKAQEVIVLPCDERHYFHSQCLRRWLKENLSWPLWKDEISIPKITRQRSFRRSSSLSI
jgi:hypothetical protein